MQAAFEAAGNPCARLDAEILIAHALGWPHLRVYSDREFELSATTLARLAGMQARRLAGEPVAYITGVQEFWGLEFMVSRDTLIPRADTETLVEVALANLGGKAAPHVLDLGTGTGCILLSVVNEIRGARGWGVDKNEGAVTLARANANRLGLASRASFAVSDWFSAVTSPKGGFGAILSNPPYIPAADIAGLVPDVRDFGPMSALEGGADGLDPYRLICARSGDFLVPGGLLAVEVGVGQADDVGSLFGAAGFISVAMHNDLAGIARVVSGKKR
jgi:release factor glutamine methyltransferase